MKTVCIRTRDGYSLRTKRYSTSIGTNKPICVLAVQLTLYYCIITLLNFVMSYLESWTIPDINDNFTVVGIMVLASRASGCLFGCPNP